MENEDLILPPYPETVPDAGLFSWEALYGMQSPRKRLAHAALISELIVRSEILLKVADMELVERSIGLEEPWTGPFQVAHDNFEEKSDEDIHELIDRHQERLLTLLGHFALSSRSYRRISTSQF